MLYLSWKGLLKEQISNDQIQKDTLKWIQQLSVAFSALQQFAVIFPRKTNNLKASTT